MAGVIRFLAGLVFGRCRILASTLHAMAKRNYTPTNSRVIEALERQVEELAGTLNAKDVANILWACGKVGFAEPALLNGCLQRRAAKG